MEQLSPVKRNTPRDVFLHLLAIVTLYWSAVSFVTLLWQYINYFFPDRLYESFYYQISSALIRFNTSALIIVFPVFILASWFLNKIYAKEYAVRESRVRKWLIYLTLFITSLIIIGDLIGIVNTLLSGEIKIRFILKALSVLLVAITVFWYYLDDVRREFPTKLARPFAWITSAFVLVVVIGTFFIVGSPTTARLMEFDQRKINDLQNIQSQIVNYWQRKETLPGTLSDLNDPISGFKVPVDPQSNTAYEYIIKDADNLTFELCAIFNKSWKFPQPGKTPPAYYTYAPDSLYSQNWDHDAGRTCFERKIDKELYPPLDKIKD